VHVYVIATTVAGNICTEACVLCDNVNTLRSDVIVVRIGGRTTEKFNAVFI